MQEFAGIQPRSLQIGHAPDGSVHWMDVPPGQGGNNWSVWTIIPPAGEAHATSVLVERVVEESGGAVSLHEAALPDGVRPVRILPLVSGRSIAASMMEYGVDHPRVIRPSSQHGAAGIMEGTRDSLHHVLDLSSGVFDGVASLTTPTHIVRGLAQLCGRATDPAMQAVANTLDPAGVLRGLRAMETVDPLTMDGFDAHHQRANVARQDRHAEQLWRDHRVLSNASLRDEGSSAMVDIHLEGYGIRHGEITRAIAAVMDGPDPVAARKRFDWVWATEARMIQQSMAISTSDGPPISAALLDPDGTSMGSVFLRRLVEPERGILDTMVARRTQPGIHQPFMDVRVGLSDRLGAVIEHPGHATAPGIGILGIAQGFSMNRFVEQLAQAKGSAQLPWCALPDRQVSRGGILRQKLAGLERTRPQVMQRLYRETVQLHDRLKVAHALTDNPLFQRDMEAFGRGRAALDAALTIGCRRTAMHGLDVDVRATASRVRDTR